jgi:hypothetical protein
MKNPIRRKKRTRTMVRSFNFRPGPGAPEVVAAVFIMGNYMALSGAGRRLYTLLPQLLRENGEP